MERVGADDALTDSEVPTNSTVASESDPDHATLANMCTTPGNTGNGFGYAWSLNAPGTESRDNAQGELTANISYAFNNNQDQSTSQKIQVDIKPAKVINSTARRPVFTMNENCQQTPTTHGHTGAHNQTHVTHARVKKHSDVFTLTCDKGGCNCDAAHTTPAPTIFPNALVFTTGDKHAMSKHFMTPIGPLQLTAEECNEILMKRAAAASTQATTNNVSTSQADTATHFGHVLTHVNATQIETKVKTQQDMGSQVRVPKERPYSCSECGKSFLLKHHLTTHARVHTGERPHICVHCGKSFAHKHCLHTHLLLHSAERPYQCRECKKSFTLKHHLVTHTRVHTRERPFVCPECGRAFPLKRHLVTHSKFHSGERPYVCSECGESFSQKDHLTMHSRFHGSLHPFVCPDCGATFQRKFELVNHGRLHGRVPHSCTVCGKEFLQKRTLLAHMRLHTGETPFACTVCGEAFARKVDLVAHSKMHNAITDEKTLTCRYLFIYFFFVKYYVLLYNTLININNYSYRECGLDFSNREALTLHLRLHTGDRTLVTDLCGLAAAFQQTPGHFLTQNTTGAHQVN